MPFLRSSRTAPVAALALVAASPAVVLAQESFDAFLRAAGELLEQPVGHGHGGVAAFAATFPDEQGPGIGLISTLDQCGAQILPVEVDGNQLGRQ